MKCQFSIFIQAEVTLIVASQSKIEKGPTSLNDKSIIDSIPATPLGQQVHIGQTMHYKSLFILKWYPSTKPSLTEIEMEATFNDFGVGSIHFLCLANANYDNAIDIMTKSIKLYLNGAATNTTDRALATILTILFLIQENRTKDSLYRDKVQTPRSLYKVTVLRSIVECILH
ncbi:DNA-directed RNA polymerase subunit beta', partial [Striga asiatica]